LAIAQEAISKSALLYEEKFKEFVREPIELNISSIEEDNPKLYEYISLNYKDEIKKAILAMSKSAEKRWFKGDYKTNSQRIYESKRGECTIFKSFLKWSINIKGTLFLTYTS